MELSPAQIQYILSAIKKKGVHSPALQEDILDHMCCLIEEEMLQTSDFRKAYLKALKKFESLRQLQAETTRSVESSGTQAIFYRMLDYLMAAVYAGLGLVFLIMPIYLTLSQWNISFLLFFSPFVFMGTYILLTRINYRRFSIIPFKETVFPDSLVH